MTTKVAGFEGFVWWFGVIEDREDPEKLGRVKVRVHNFHGDEVLTPTNDLHWAPVIVSAVSSSLNQVGVSPVGLQKGSTVFGFFADGQNGQIPIVLGSLHGIPESDKTKHDVSSLAREVNTLRKETVGPEPVSAYSAVYPYNKVFQSESGHVIEIDDSPSKERLHIFHKKGTYTEINSDGRYVKKVVDNDIEVVIKDKVVYVQGSSFVEIKGSSSVVVDGNVDITVKGNYNLNVSGELNINGNRVIINKGSKGAARIGDTTDTKSGTHSHSIQSGSSTVLIGD